MAAPTGIWWMKDGTVANTWGAGTVRQGIAYGKKRPTDLPAVGLSEMLQSCFLATWAKWHTGPTLFKWNTSHCSCDISWEVELYSGLDTGGSVPLGVAVII